MTTRTMTLLYVLLFITQCSGFSFLLRLPSAPSFSRSTITSLSAKVALEPEPSGGEELAAVTSMAGCRMKDMGPAKDIKSELGTVHQFWMLGEADGSLVKEYHQQLLKDASKKANFPGFRKGQVPPFALPKITYFSVREAIIKTVEAAVKGYGLKALSGSDGEVNVKEDTEAMCKGYRMGDSIQFTATLCAVFDPLAARPEATGVQVVAQDEDALSSSTSLD